MEEDHFHEYGLSGIRKNSIVRVPDWEDRDMEQYMKKFQSAQEKLVDDSGDDPFESADITTIMSLFYQKQNLAISIFNIEAAILSICQIHYWPGAGECSLLFNLIHEYGIKKILTSTSSDKIFLEDLSSVVSSCSHSVETILLSAKEFSSEISSARVRLLSFSAEPKAEERSSRETPFDKISISDDQLILRSTGALFSFALREAIVNELEGNSSPIYLSEIQTIESTGRLLIDIAAYDSLQIFKVENHPSFSGIGTKKEGLSLFGLMDKTKSPVGRKLLKRWFLSPFYDRSKREERLDAIAFFQAPEHSPIFQELHQTIRFVKDVERILYRIKAVRASLMDWVKLFQSIVNVLKISELIQPFRSKHPIFNEILNECTPDLLAISNEMYQLIDFDESKEQKRLVPREGIDSRLDELKNTYNGLEAFLTELGEEELEKLSAAPIYNIRCVYYPQIGFQIAIPRSECESFLDSTSKDIPNSKLEFQFMTSSFAYFKNETMREVDQQIGDVYCNIIDAENSIIRMLEKNVLEKEKGIISIVKIIARLDCLLSLASAARDFGFSRPQLFDENILIIEDGRHPLQEMCVSQFIPNDTTISGSRERVKLITGPNFSGKSVYLKQVGIIVFLAHIGSFVPAKFAQVGIFDKIFTRISSRETVSVGQSSFFLDCRQMANMINNSTERSLLLVDEFGKGTNSIDGTAILAATLNEFLRKIRPPVLLVTTHCLDQKFFEFLDTNANQYQALHMSIHLVAENCERETEEIVYLYKLVEGIASQSYGRHVAELAGVPITLLERADQVTRAIRAGEPVETVLQQRNEMVMYEKVISLFNSFDCVEGDLDQLLSGLRLISGAN